MPELLTQNQLDILRKMEEKYGQKFPSPEFYDYIKAFQEGGMRFQQSMGPAGGFYFSPRYRIPSAAAPPAAAPAEWKTTPEGERYLPIETPGMTAAMMGLGPLPQEAVPGTGGYAIFGEPEFKQPGFYPVEQEKVVPKEKRIAKALMSIRKNPALWMQQMELKLGQTYGLASPRVAGYRESLARLMLQAGVEPTIAITYAQEGLSSRTVGYMQAREKLRQTLNLAALEAESQQLTTRQPTIASVQAQEDEARRAGLWGVVIEYPDGSVVFKPLRSPGYRDKTIQYILQQWYTNTLSPEEQKKKALWDKRFTVIGGLPRKVPIGRLGKKEEEEEEEEGEEKKPFTPTEEEISDVVKEIMQRRGR